MTMAQTKLQAYFVFSVTVILTMWTPAVGTPAGMESLDAAALLQTFPYDRVQLHIIDYIYELFFYIKTSAYAILCSKAESYPSNRSGENRVRLQLFFVLVSAHPFDLLSPFRLSE